MTSAQCYVSSLNTYCGLGAAPPGIFLFSVFKVLNIFLCPNKYLPQFDKNHVLKLMTSLPLISILSNNSYKNYTKMLLDRMNEEKAVLQSETFTLSDKRAANIEKSLSLEFQPQIVGVVLLEDVQGTKLFPNID